MPDSPAKETARYDAAGYNDVAAMISDYRIRRTRSPTIPEIRDKLEISRTKAYEHRRRFFTEELAAIREIMAYEIPNAIARYLESAEKSLRMLIEALDKASNPKDMVILIEKLEDTHFKMIRIMGLEGVGMLDEIDRRAAARRRNDDGGNGNNNSGSNASEKTDEDDATAAVTATTAGKNNVRGILDMMKEKAGDTVTFADGLDDDSDDDNSNAGKGEEEKEARKTTAAKGSNNAGKKDHDDQNEQSKKVYCGSLTGDSKKNRRDSINTFIGDTVDSINDAEAY